MMWPPSVLRMRIQDRRHRFRLWLPLFLVWPVVVVLVLAVLPLAVVGVAATGRFGIGSTRLPWSLPAVLVAPLAVVMALAVLLLALATLPVILVLVVLAVPAGILWVGASKLSQRRSPPTFLVPPVLAILAVAALPLMVVALALALVQLPLVLIAALVLWNRDIGRVLLLAGPRFFQMLCALRGLRVQVQDGPNQVHIALW